MIGVQDVRRTIYSSRRRCPTCFSSWEGLSAAQGGHGNDPVMSSPPRLLAIRSIGELIQYITALLSDSHFFPTLAAVIILGDALLTQLIIRFVPCTLVYWPIIPIC